MVHVHSSECNHKRIFYLVADYGGCGWYRCHVPGVALMKRGHDVILDHKINTAIAESFDIIVFQRQVHPGILEVLKYANSIGKTTVYELDDDIWNIDMTNPGYPFWSKPHNLEAAQNTIREAKLVTTTTKRLARYMNRFNKNTFVLPNMLPEEHWRVKPLRKKKGDPLIVGWAGSMHHWQDLNILEGTIQQVIDEYPNIEFDIAGAGDAIPFRPHERMILWPSVKIEEYPKIINHFDIGLAPVTDKHFNKCKSDLKFIEYGMLGVPGIFSKVESYTGTVIHGENGFLAKNTKDWLRFIKLLIEDQDLRKTIGKNAKEYAITRTIDKNIHLWEEAYGIE